MNSILSSSVVVFAAALWWGEERGFCLVLPPLFPQLPKLTTAEEEFISFATRKKNTRTLSFWLLVRYTASRRTTAFLAANDAPSLCMKKKSIYQMLLLCLAFFSLKVFFPLGNDWLFPCYGPRVHILEIQEIPTSQLRGPLDPHNSTRASLSYIPERIDTSPSSKDPEAERASFSNAERHLGLLYPCFQDYLYNFLIENRAVHTMWKFTILHCMS